MTLSNLKQVLHTAFIIALIQFSNALEYMMINPIFPHIGASLGLPVSHAGYVASTYTLASVVSGVVAFFVVDRCNKKNLLLTHMLLLALLTALTPYASSLAALITLRLLAGLVGGVTLGVGMALLLNQTPAAMRGQAIAIVLSAFSAVSIVGLPLVLWLANDLGWSWSFWLVAGLCLLCLPLIHCFLQPDGPPQAQAQQTLRLNGRLLFGASASGLANFSPFVLMPILAPVFTEVLLRPATQLPLLFLVGGLSALVGTKLAGWACDRHSPVLVATVATLVFVLSLVWLWLPLPALVRAYGFMLWFMLATYGRMVAATVLAAAIPSAAQRGGFSVLQTALNHLAASAAFALPAWWLMDQGVSAATLQPLFWFMGGSALLLIPYLQRLSRKGAPS